MTDRCKWLTPSGTRCKNNVLMDGFCTRHLKQRCTICFEDVKSTNSPTTKRLQCGHSFHISCILQWFVTSNECPVCRKQQKKDSFLQFKERVEENMRQKYKDALRSNEQEITRLREALRRHQN